MDEEIGKWLLDISKYIITGYVLVRMFGKEENTLRTFIGAIALAAFLFVVGLVLIRKGKNRNNKKKGK